ncbi:MAG: tetratricopeptide repeat protein [Candidatus Latescibacteria bacterium]|nr:tetratricopeptide repeat protein [Candidatus Latescibacterota bacterium]
MKRLVFWLALFILFTTTVDGRTESVAPAEVDSVLEAKRHHSFAKEYDKNRMYEDAILQYQKSLSFKIDNPNVHYDLANLLYRLKRYREAQQQCLQCLQVDSTFVFAHYLLGLLWYEVANYDSAIVEFEKTIALDPSYTQIHRTLANLYSYKGLDGKALQQYLRTAEVGDNSSREEEFQLFLHLGNLLANRDFLSEAISCYRHSLTFRKDEQLLQKLARLQLENGLYRGALDSYLALTEGNITDDQLFLKIADISVKLGAINQAILALKKLAILRPTDPEPLSHLAEIYLQQGQLGTAKTYIDRGLAIDQDNPRLYVLKGEYHKKKGAKKIALICFKKALSDPTWGKYAQRMIWEIQPPLTEEEKLKREFFSRGKRKEQ